MGVKLIFEYDRRPQKLPIRSSGHLIRPFMVSVCMFVMSMGIDFLSLEVTLK